MSLIRLHEIAPIANSIILAYARADHDTFKKIIFTLAPDLIKSDGTEILVLEVYSVTDRVFTRDLNDHELEYLEKSLAINIENLLGSRVWVKLVRFSDVEIDIIISKDPITNHTDLYLTVEP